MSKNLQRTLKSVFLIAIACLLASFAVLIQPIAANADASDFTQNPWPQQVTLPSRTITPKVTIEVPHTTPDDPTSKTLATDGTNLWVEANAGVINEYGPDGALLGTATCGSGTINSDIEISAGYVWALNNAGFVCQIDPKTFQVVHTFNPKMGGTYGTNQSMTVLKGILFFPVNVNWCRQWIYAYNITTYQYSTTAVQDDNCVTLNNNYYDTYRIVSHDGTLWTTNRTGGSPVILKHWDVSIGADGVPTATLLLSEDLTALSGISCATAPTFIGNEMWVGSCWNQSGLMAINSQTGAIDQIFALPGISVVTKLISVGTKIWFFDGASIVGEYDTVASKIDWVFRNIDGAGDIQGHLPVPTIIGSKLNTTDTGVFVNGDLWVTGFSLTSKRYIYNMGSIADPTVPTAPTEVNISAGDSSSRVNFHVPADDGGTGIKFYTVTASPGGQSCTVQNPTWDTRRMNALDTNYYDSNWEIHKRLGCILEGPNNKSNFSVSVVATSFWGDGQASAPVTYQARAYASPILSATIDASKFASGVGSMASNGSQIYLNGAYNTEVWDPASGKILYTSAFNSLGARSLVKVGDSMYSVNENTLWKFSAAGGAPTGSSTTAISSGRFTGDIAANSSTIVVAIPDYGLAGISVSTRQVLWTNRIPSWWHDWLIPGNSHRLAVVGDFAYSACRSFSPDGKNTYWQFGGQTAAICKISLADGSVVAQALFTDHYGFNIDPWEFIIVAAGQNIALGTREAMMLFSADDLTLLGSALTPAVAPLDLVVIGNHIFEIFRNSDVVKEFSASTAALQSSFTASGPGVLVAHQGDLYVIQQGTAAKYTIPADPAKPSAPTAVIAVPAGESAKVSWTAPSNGGAAIDSYTVTASDSFNASNGGQTCVAALTSCVVTGLTDGEPYTFSVRATNWVGSSIAGLSNVVTPTAQVASLFVVTGDRSLTATWDVSNPSSSFASYLVSTTSGDGTSCVTTQRSCLISDLVNGTQYSIRVQAFDQSGNVASDVSADPVTPVGLPGVATNVNAVASDSAATITFSPAPANGGAVTYVVTGLPDGKKCTTTSTTCTVTGLTNGTSYRFTIVASNSFGSSMPSEASNSVIPSLLPSQVTNVKAWGQDSSALVRWSAQTSNGALTLVSYVVSDGRGHTCATVNTSCVVNGLTNGTTYSFKVTAYFDNGASLASEPSNSVTPPEFPGSIAGVSVIPDNGSLQVSWTAVSAANVSYVVVANDGTSCATTTTSCLINGLIDGTSYSLTVYGMDQSGNQWQADAITASPVPTAPETPTSIGVAANDGSVTISWNPGDDNGAPITNYRVVDANGSTAQCVTSELYCTISGLTNGTKYSFAVSATNSAGTSAPSAPMNATPAALPGEVQNLTATSGDAQALVSWLAPVDADANTTYQVTAATDRSLVYCVTQVLSCIINGLTNGSIYSFAVQSLSDTGGSVASAVSNSVTPATVASAPRVSTVVAASGRATVLIGAPTSNGGSPITKYIVTTSTGMICETTTLECTFLNLANGQPLTFTVVADNGVGLSLGSAQSAVVIPQGVSASPTNLKAIAGSGKVTLSWSTPADNGGSAIQSYLVDDGQGDSCSTTTLTCTISGLKNGVKYTFTAVAVNAVGASGAATILATPFSAPEEVKNVSATFVATTATVRWAAADGNGQSVKYVVVDLFGRKCVTTDLSCVIGGLSFGVSDSFTVVATSISGAGATSTPSNTIVPISAPSAPTTIRATAGNGTVTVSWQASLANGTPITSYIVTALTGETCVTTALTCTVRGLTGGKSYKFVVQAVNQSGSSSKSQTASATPASAPSAPSISMVTPLNGSVRVNFTPGAANGSAITSYDYSVDGGLTYLAAAWASGSKSFLINGLTNGTAYTIRIRSVNAMGSGTPSSSKLVTPLTVPSAARIVSVVGGQRSIILTFNAPLTDGGSSLVGYSYSVDGGLHWSALPAGTASGSVTISHLQAKTSYKVQVRAANKAGSSASSGTLTVTTK
jgi:hypothetical protein